MAGASMSLKVEGVMVGEVITVGGRATGREAVELMNKHENGVFNHGEQRHV